MQLFYKKGRVIISCIVLLVLAFAALPAAAQMKFGGPPTLRNDAILELNSDRKGLLLPRVSNTAMNALPLDTAAAGMLIFNTADQSLYIKKLSGNTPWTRINDASSISLGNLSDLSLSSPQNGQLLRFNAGAWSNWTPDYITSSQALSFSGGDVEGSGTIAGGAALNLKNLHGGGTFPKLTYNGKGLVTGGSALSAADIVAGSTNYIQNQVASAQAAGFNVNGAGTVKSLTVTDMAVNGGLLFTNGSGAVAQKAAQLVWDNGANELGIGIANPRAKLDVNGNFKLGVAGTVLTNIQKTFVAINSTTNFDYNSVRKMVVQLPAGVVLKDTDNVILNPRADLPDRIAIAWCRVSDAANRMITVCFTNSGNNTNIGNHTYDVTIIQN